MEFHLTSCVRGYLKSERGGVINYQREEEDPYIVAVISNCNVYVVGNILRLMSAACSLPPSRTFEETS